MIQIQEKNQCCGCEACAQVCPRHCIEMNPDIEGFLYPSVDLSSCVGCHLCEAICPIKKSHEARVPISVYAAKHKLEDIRKKSSSGGVFYALAEAIIGQGGIVFGARFDEQWDVHHRYAKTLEEVYALMGSKYVQSRIGDCYKQVRDNLEQNVPVLFCGTACQVAGLRSFLRKDYLNLLTMDVFCHGVPSPGLWRDYRDKTASELAGKNTVSHSISSISFRDKSLGWKKFSFCLRIDKALAAVNENSVFASYYGDNSYMKTFLQNYNLRPSCYHCAFREGRCGSDLSVGDYWGYDKCHEDDDKGMNAILVNTLKGKEFLLGCNIDIQEDCYKDVLEGNPVIQDSVYVPKYRAFFWKHYNGDVDETMKKVIAKEKPSSLKVLLYNLREKLLRRS